MGIVTHLHMTEYCSFSLHNTIAGLILLIRTPVNQKQLPIEATWGKFEENHTCT